MAKKYIVASDYCAQRETKHDTLAEAIVEMLHRQVHEQRCGYYVEPFITTSEADDCGSGLTDEERELIEEAEMVLAGAKKLAG